MIPVCILAVAALQAVADELRRRGRVVSSGGAVVADDVELDGWDALAPEMRRGSPRRRV